MKLKHTAGPWFAERLDRLKDHINVWHGSGIAHIAAVSTGVLPDASALSNATLIAAAPDMLEALKKAKNWIECDQDNYEEMTEYDKSVFDNTISSIHEAINKATTHED